MHERGPASDDERRVARLLDGHRISYGMQHIVNFCDEGARFAKIDFVILERGHVIFLEIDTHQHKYDYASVCETARMMHIATSLMSEGNQLSLTIIRFNPSTYYVDGKRVHRPIEERHQMLVDVIQASSKIDLPLTIYYLFYDCYTDSDDILTLRIHDDPDYHSTIRSCCMPPIV